MLWRPGASIAPDSSGWGDRACHHVASVIAATGADVKHRVLVLHPPPRRGTAKIAHALGRGDTAAATRLFEVACKLIRTNRTSPDVHFAMRELGEVVIAGGMTFLNAVLLQARAQSLELVITGPARDDRRDLPDTFHC